MIRSHSLGGVEIPEDVWWIDEFDWSAVEQITDRGLTGALIVHQGVKQHGRPITLQSNVNGGWVARAVVLALQAQRAQPDARFALQLADGREFLVIHDLAQSFTAEPVRPAADMTSSTPYRIRLPLMTVAPE